MAYLYKLYIVMDEEPDDISKQNVVDAIAEEVMANQLNAEVVGAQICELEDSDCGRCCKCGTWVSDKEKEAFVEGFSDGCVIDGEWWCDLCVPPAHPKRF